MTINSWIYFLSTLSLGIFTPVDTYTSIHIGTDSFDSEQPMVSLGIEYDVNKFQLFFEHQSSPWTLKDNGLNHIGVKYNFDNNFYIGSSKKIDDEGFLVLGGYEKQNFFIEYSYDRIYSGLKFTF